MEPKQRRNSCMSPSQSQSPLPKLPSSSLLGDISNFKTPKHSSRIPSSHTPCPQFFTASKNTPLPPASSMIQRRPPSSVPRSKATRRLKAFEIEQSKSARKAQISKEKSLQSLARSLTVWLNFLFENPRSCGIDVSKFTGEGEGEDTGGESAVSEVGKRDSWPTGGVRVDRPWRGPKRQRDSSWVGAVTLNSATHSASTYEGLRSSLTEICSLDDLKLRLGIYLSLSGCKEIFDVMTQVTKNIDEGRIQMKANCPMVTDVGMKEKALRILMCYNPIWLRIGLFIILGGDSLLPNEDVNSEQEITFLKAVIEKQFFTHTGLAKAYAYNKMVDGLYRPGYFEKLGNVLLKRLLLLVLVLDRAKSQNSLPLKYGIDGLDGGSPLLFTLQSIIKSSRQVIQDLLSSDVMHGEGNLLGHLVIIGYKISYQQNPLNEYHFKVNDLFEDLQDGVRLCRAIQLLQHDSSILMKVIVPSESRKKNLVNCGIALQYLKQASVPLFDEDAALITGEDVVNKDKELTISLLWNMFVHLQLPLLINGKLLSQEISKIREVHVEYSNTCNLLNLLLSWIQAICEGYNFTVESFSSLVDGKAMWFVLDHYFRKEHQRSYSSKDSSRTNGEVSLMSATDCTDAVHNFILSQKLISLLGNFPEVLQVSDILEHNGACNDRSVIILLVFLSFQLLVKRNVNQLNFHKLSGFNCQSPLRRHISTERWLMHSDAVLNQDGIHENRNEDSSRSFKAIMAWWQEMAQQNNKHDFQPPTALRCISVGRQSSGIERENAAIVIQSHFRRFKQHCNYLQMKNATSLVQAAVRAWLTVNKSAINKLEMRKHTETFGRYMTYMKERHKFVKLRRSVVIMQRAIRGYYANRVAQIEEASTQYLAATKIQSYVRGWLLRKGFVAQKQAIVKIQSAVRCMICMKGFQHKKLALESAVSNQHAAATIIQSYFCCWLLRRSFMAQKQAIIKIQSAIRCLICRRDFQRKKLALKTAVVIPQVEEGLNQYVAATKIQSYFRGWLLRKNVVAQKQAIIKIQSAVRFMRGRRNFHCKKLAVKSAVKIQSHVRGWSTRTKAYKELSLIIMIQSHCRGWLLRRELAFQKEATIKIQSIFRCMKIRNWFHSYRHAAIEMQRYFRGQITRKRLLGASSLHIASSHVNLELRIVTQSVLKLQRMWRQVSLVKLRTDSAIVIQSYVRGWIARQRVARNMQWIIIVQSYWKGYLARKHSRGQLLDLRLRMQTSAANVDDGMRIINRLIKALSELLSKKSISSILHTCATLNMATEHSQKCCEELVKAGAINTLLRLISSVSRSIPDQEVLKHTVSTLRNLARYPHLSEILIDSRGSLEVIMGEFLRNKEDAYFIASELLKRVCLNQKGIKAIRNLPAHLKRLHALVEDLSRKAAQQKRNARGMVAREHTERRLIEATALLKIITNYKANIDCTVVFGCTDIKSNFEA